MAEGQLCDSEKNGIPVGNSFQRQKNSVKFYNSKETHASWGKGKRAGQTWLEDPPPSWGLQGPGKDLREETVCPIPGGKMSRGQVGGGVC